MSYAAHFRVIADRRGRLKEGTSFPSRDIVYDFLSTNIIYSQNIMKSCNVLISSAYFRDYM